MKTKAIEIRRLTFRYPDGTQALNDISFCVDDGESVGLIGPNGAGKTTLMLHLNGILKGEGSVRIYERDVCAHNLAAVRSDVGVVFQDPDIQLFMPTVFDDVAFGPMNMGLKKAEVDQRVLGALSSVDLEGFQERICHHLSFGEKKRVALATVLSMAPKILVLDEPTSNLDPKHRNRLIEILKDIRATKLIASHDLEMIAALTETVFFLEEGRIALQGPTPEVLADRELVRRFLIR